MNIAEGGLGILGEDQLAWLKEALASLTLVAMMSAGYWGGEMLIGR